MDSLDTTEIAMAVEDEFNLEIPVETMDLLLECFRANSTSLSVRQRVYIALVSVKSMKFENSLKHKKDSKRINRSYLR